MPGRCSVAQPVEPAAAFAALIGIVFSDVGNAVNYWVFH
jgi:hypothetical protein